MADKRERRLSSLLKESRRLARSKRRRLAPSAQAELAALHAAAKEALGSGDPSRVDGALQALEAAFLRYLAPHRKSRLRGYAEVVVVAAVLAWVVRGGLVETFRLSTAAMAPTLLPGDLVVVTKAAYGFHLPGLGRLGATGAPARGDVVLFTDPRRQGALALQRVVGIAGDEVEVRERVLSVNGVAQDRLPMVERYEYWNHRGDLDYWHPQTGSVWWEALDGKRYATLTSRLPTLEATTGPFVVPEGHVFLLGDNRDQADDGRAGGGWFLPLENLEGRAAWILLSWGPGGWAPWGERGLRFGRTLLRVDRSLPGG